MRRRPDPKTVLLLLVGIAVALGTGPAVAQAVPPEGADAGGGDAAVAEAAPPAWCADRPPMSAVLAYDAGKHFRKVETMARQSTDDLLATLCPGDQVRLVSFGTTVDWLGDAFVLEDAASREAVAKRLLHRPRPSDMSSVNDSLVKTALAWWEGGGLREGDVPALFVFTDTIESSKPTRAVVIDFRWDDPPSWVQGRFLLVVALLDKDAPGRRAKLYVTAQPTVWAHLQFPSGADVTFDRMMGAFEPPPEPPVRIVERVVEVERSAPQAAPWLLWFGTLPGVASLAGAVVLLMLLFYFIGRGRRRRPTEVAGKAHPSREVTIVLWDRLHREVLREETRTLDESLRIGPTSDADFVVPGPYALDVVNGNGEGALVRSANVLGLEMHRAGGRTLTLQEGESQALHPGDRVDLGGGHEVEVRVH